MSRTLAVICLILCSCGGDSNGGNTEPDIVNTGDALCGAFEACGGDPVGTWEFESICIDNLPQLDAEEPACQEAITGSTS